MSYPQAISIPYDDLDILLIGPALEQGPLPTVLYFSLRAEDSLLIDPFNQPIVELLRHPDALQTIRLIAITLPCHKENSPQDALRMWATELQQGNDILTPFIEKVCAFLNDAKQKQQIHENQLGLIGLSRGGWIACQIAARTKVKAISLFAPLTKISLSPDFSFIAPHQIIPFNLDSIVESLVGIPIHIWISNRDTRVSTRHSFEFIEALVASSWNRGIRAPSLFLNLVPPIGAQGHGTTPESFKAGARWLLNQLL